MAEKGRSPGKGAMPRRNDPAKQASAAVEGNLDAGGSQRDESPVEGQESRTMNEDARSSFFLPKEEETKFVCVVNQFSCSMSQCLLINVKIDVKCFIVRCYAMYYFSFYLFQYRCKQVTKTFFFFTLFPFSISHRQNHRGNRV